MKAYKQQNIDIQACNNLLITQKISNMTEFI